MNIIQIQPCDQYKLNGKSVWDVPCIFLAGPIKSARNWQDEATDLLKQAFLKYESDREILIASPRNSKKDYKPLNVEFDDQIDWETQYLNFASKSGVILFWLANEETHFCERAFAQTTRLELGEWLAKSIHTSNNVVVGIDTKFSGAGYIKHRIEKNYPKIVLCNSLENTVDAVVKQVIERNPHWFSKKE